MIFNKAEQGRKGNGVCSLPSDRPRTGIRQRGVAFASANSPAPVTQRSAQDVLPAVVLLAVDGKLVGLISPRDEAQPEAVEVLKKLRANGIRRIVMLTGDHPEIAEVVVGELGIDE